MTATEVGLPTSPVVDGGGNLRPEWLHAIVGIEELNSLKAEFEKIKGIDVGELADAVDAAAAVLADILSQPVPNNVVASNFLQTEMLTSAGIHHGLGTASYIPMVRNLALNSGNDNQSPYSFTGDELMPQKNDIVWSRTPDVTANPGLSSFTFTVIPAQPRTP